MGAFVISPLPSVLVEELLTAGSLHSTGITPLPRYYGPLRHPLVFDRLPGSSGYTAYLAPPISRRDQEGFSSCFARPCHHAVATTPPKRAVASVSCAGSCCLRPTVAGSASGIPHFRGHLCVHFRYGLMTRSPSFRWLCRWASSICFRSSLPSSLRGF